ncbi:MAG: lipase family protein [Clostridia bacterium]|nr:lipase family protein [Clostridia bacterium]MBQ8657747.1 lipase family protein [Clostridia bacterium]
MNLYELFSECMKIPYAQTGISANYAVKREGTTLYLFFQGSNGKNDWKSNLDFPAKPYKRMGKTVWFAHRGFLNVWKEIEPMLEKDIADPYFKSIVITGYSHGAAIALLCHEYVWFHRSDLRNTTEGYGFGCPRVFWGVRGKKLKKRWETFLVIRNLNDLVTHLPPAFLGYSHVSKILKIGQKGKYSPLEAHQAENILTELAAYETK